MSRHFPVTRVLIGLVVATLLVGCASAGTPSRLADRAVAPASTAGATAPAPTAHTAAVTPPSGTSATVGAQFISVSAGSQYTCAIRSDGTLACWGDDAYGQASPPSGTFTAVSAGVSHTCAIRSDGTLACWGADTSGQASPPAGTITDVGTGGSHACAIRVDGTLACWGYDADGRATPPVGTFTAVSAGVNYTCAIRTDGTLACWGDNEDGQAAPPAGTFAAVSAAQEHTCAIRSDGTLACWGDNSDGEAAPPAGTFTAVSADGHHTCAIRSDGTLACWGYDTSGQASPPAGTFLAVSAGGEHTCAIRMDGTLACWGSNQCGPNECGQATPPPNAAVAALPRWTVGRAVPLAWSGVAATNPVVSYDVRYRRAKWNGVFGSHTRWVTGTTATSATFTASVGYTYCFSARARDAGGALSPWSGERCTAIPLDDRSLTRSGKWTAGHGSVYYRTTFLRSATKGARLARTGVRAQWISLVATTCPTCGTVKVLWNGSLLKTVSLYSASRANRRLITVKRFVRIRTGAIEIRVVSSGRKVLIDGVAISTAYR